MEDAICRMVKIWTGVDFTTEEVVALAKHTEVLWEIPSGFAFSHAVAPSSQAEQSAVQ